MGFIAAILLVFAFSPLLARGVDQVADAEDAAQAADAAQVVADAATQETAAPSNQTGSGATAAGNASATAPAQQAVTPAAPESPATGEQAATDENQAQGTAVDVPDRQPATQDASSAAGDVAAGDAAGAKPAAEAAKAPDAAADSTYNPNAPARTVTQGVTVGLWSDQNHQHPVTSQTPIDLSKSYYGQLNIDFSDAEKPTLASPNIKYTIPNETVAKTQDGPLYDEDNHLAGHWYVRKNGEIELAYNEDWLNANSSEIKAHVSFEFKFNDDVIDKPGDHEFTFPGTGTTTTVTIQDGKVTGKKQGAFDNASKTITYTIPLKVAKPGSRDVTLTDKLGDNLSFVNGSFKLNDAALGADKLTVNGQSATIKLGDLKPGTYTITYQTKISDNALKQLGNNQKLDKVGNSASWTWNGNSKPGTGSYTPDLSYQMLTKGDGEKQGDGTIKWTVQLNNGGLKADMGGYVFKDTLPKGMSYTGTFKVLDENWQPIGGDHAIDTKKGSFSYTFPKDAGYKKYVIQYTTKLDDADATGTFKNHAEVTPPNDDGHKGEGDGSYTPGTPVTPDDKVYVEKQLTKNDAATDGTATWTSTVKTSLMDAATDPATVKFDDSMWTNNASKDAAIWFKDDTEPVLKAGRTPLAKDVDYTLNWWNKKDGHYTGMSITFKDTEAVKAALGKTDVTVTYQTQSTGSGSFYNRSTVTYKGKQTNAEAHYDVEKAPNLEKDGKDLTWDANFDWGKVDGSSDKGAWVATWSLDINENNIGWDNAGNVDLKGKPVNVTDTLSQGMRYVPGSVTATVSAGNYPGPQKLTEKQGEVIVDTSTANTLKLTIPTASVTQQADGSCRARVQVTYKTAAKASAVGAGEEGSFTNKAQAGSGSVDFGHDSDTVTGRKKVVYKSSDRDKNSTTGFVGYTIEVNPTALDLVHDADTLTLTDTLDPDASLVTSTIKVTDLNTGSTAVAPVEVENVKDKDGRDTVKLTITVPDSRALKVYYEVKPIGDAGDKVQLTNSASLSGVANGSDTNDRKWNVIDSSAGTEGSAGTFSVTKTDQANINKKLAGARFQLYKVNVARLGTAVKPTDVQIIKASDKVGEERTTPANGVVRFGSSESPLELNVLYAYAETAAPKGYKLDGTLHFVMLKGNDEQQYDAALAQAKAHGINPSAATSYTAYDEKIPDKVTSSVTLGKKIDGRAWKDGETFSFTLAAQTKGSTVSEAELKAAMPRDTTATATKPFSGDVSSFTFGDFTFAKEGTYVYVVKEQGAGNTKNGLKNSDQTATVTFKVSKDKLTQKLTVTRTVAGLSSSSGASTFVNTYKPAAAKANLRAQKALTDTTFDKTGSFTFELAAQGGTLSGGASVDAKSAPMPKGAKDGVLDTQVSDGKAFSFGEMTYDKAGTYRYTISEITPKSDADRTPGLAYSNALYVATVTVTDDGNGTLTAATELKQTVTDGGADIKDADQKADADGVATITNTFSYRDAMLGLIVNKSYTGDTASNPLTAGKFQFTLTATGGTKADNSAIAAADVPMPEGAKDGSFTQGIAADSKATFPDITYTLDRDNGNTYTYEVREVSSGERGMTYDQTVYTVAVKVSYDDAKKALKAERTITVNGERKDAISFSNTYKADQAQATIKAHKTLTGRPLKAGEFKFDLYDGVLFFPDSAKLLQSKTNDAGGDVTFDPLTYAKEGTHTYTLVEEVPSKTNGVSYQNAYEYVTVDVKLDKATDKLVASVTDINTASDTAQFKNDYTANGYVYFTARKRLTSADGGKAPALKSGQFKFKLYRGADVTKEPIETLTNTSDGVVTTGRIAYSLEDAVNAETGETASGAISVPWLESKGYATAATVDGHRAWTVSYTLAEVGPDGTTLAGAGNNQKDGVTYDARRITFKVTIVDSGTGFLATMYQDSDAGDQTVEAGTFTNAYTASGNAELALAKTVNGKKPAAGQEFTFSVAAKEGTGTPAVDKSMATDADGNASLKLTYGLADAGKTYQYVIHETSAAGAGWTNAGDVTATVAVGTDRGDGTLSPAQVTYSTATGANGTGAAAFDNTYVASGSLALQGTKTMEGADWPAGHTYTFNLTDADGKVVSTATATPTADDNPASFSFPAVEYTLEGLNGNKNAAYDPATQTWTLHYTAAEDASALPAGVSSKTAPIDVTVTVKDSGDGTLTATARQDGSGDSAIGTAAAPLAFTNVFDDEATVSIAGRKALDASGTDTALGSLAGAFTFTLAGDDGAPLPQDAQGATATTAQNTAAGTVSFGSITYKRSDLKGAREKTFTYTVKETGSIAGVVNDKDAVKTFKVTVTDNGDKGLSVATDQASPMELFTFTNTYRVSEAAVTLQAVKTVNGGKPGSLAQPQSFTFVLAAQGGTVDDEPVDAGKVPMPDGKAGGTATASSDRRDGGVSFGKIAYAKPGTYRYAITEKADGKAGYGYTDKVSNVVVTVVDNHDGTLGTSVAYDGAADKPAFDNAYTAAGSAQITATKRFNGDDASAAQLSDFSFQLLAGDDSESDTAVLQTVRASKDGGVTFDPIDYTLADLEGKDSKTFTYSVREVAPANGVQDGIVYDGHVATYLVTVADRGDGTLDTKVALAKDSSSEFVNAYRAREVEVALGAHKTLQGRELKDGEFSFALYEGSLTAGQLSAAQPRATATAAADGTVRFKGLVFDHAGTYEYTIAEQAEADGTDGVVYDRAVHHATVRVTDDGKGNLVAEVSYDGASAQPEFVNTYSEKTRKPKGDKPRGGLPQTGDAAMAGIACALGAGVAFVGAGVVLKRRQR